VAEALTPIARTCYYARPMAAQERKRPFYLVLALTGALALGMLGACNGWATITYYRAPIDPIAETRGIVDDEDRAAVEARIETYVHTLDAAQSRGWPLAVATMLVGSAIVFFAMRAMGGSRGARAALVQLIVAQAALTAASFWLMRDVDEAELGWRAYQVAARRDETHERHEAAEVTRLTERMARTMGPVVLALRTLGSTLVLVALTRRRSRDLLDAAAAAIRER
jgi:hypothetical protein